MFLVVMSLLNWRLKGKSDSESKNLQNFSIGHKQHLFDWLGQLLGKLMKRHRAKTGSCK